ncbi:WbqC family protein [Paenibacillus radicis (ex Xue et al. 2023)]|uniref:WbqC family protein n=1 Tax=Paenibacillus radicis (ex Xue et al. 2023) TaxID=2972489 RepID=A0ABT1YUB1_9BACL|nr:WbqC family protein [Paenibacillus radicis (ex Xue et al. 2023)]MCR8635984.1 WbqC family protein [Paenibacillus radicis (ex Xue et al. 2023)]
MKKIAIIQSNYIPWKGYFDIINDCDLFILYDDVQYTHGDWRNRNKIKTNNGTSWLTIPVGAHLDKLTCQVQINDNKWQIKHWKSLQASYSRTSYFKYYRDFLEYVYLEKNWSYLSELNQYLIKHISKEFLGIKTEIRDSSEYNVQGKKLDRVIDLVKIVEGDIYISGPAAKDYIITERFEKEGIRLVYKDYQGYPEYDQVNPPFEHSVSILDLLFHVGPDAPYYIWGWRDR